MIVPSSWPLLLSLSGWAVTVTDTVTAPEGAAIVIVVLIIVEACVDEDEPGGVVYAPRAVASGKSTSSNKTG